MIKSHDHTPINFVGLYFIDEERGDTPDPTNDKMGKIVHLKPKPEQPVKMHRVRRTLGSRTIAGTFDETTAAACLQSESLKFEIE